MRPACRLAALALALATLGCVEAEQAAADQAVLERLSTQIAAHDELTEADAEADTQFIVLPAPGHYRITATSADSPLDPERLVELLASRLWHSTLDDVQQVAVILHTSDGLRYDTATALDVHPADAATLRERYGPRSTPN